MAKPTSTAPSNSTLNVRIEQLRYADLIPLELNARYMTHETFERLVENIRRDGHPTQLPFCWLNRDRGGYEILSGNHRREAVLAALGDDYTGPVLVTDDDLTREQRIAIQLSHNSIAGDDDPAILRELYDLIGDVDWKLYSALDDSTLELLDRVNLEGLSEANLDYQTVTLLFLPDEQSAIVNSFNAARDAIPNGCVWLTAMADYDRLLDSLTTTSGAWDVQNQALALRLLIDVFDRHLTDLQAGWWDSVNSEPRHSAPVPLATILGQDRVPTLVAMKLKRLTDDLLAAGTIERPLDVLAYLLALASP